MANIASQEKRIHRAERERLENLRRTSQVKTWFRRLESAVSGGDNSTADDEYRTLVSRIDKAVKSGALHRNNGARKKARAARIRSRLSYPFDHTGVDERYRLAPADGEQPLPQGVPG